jgi:hypothetical protein
VIYTEEQPNRTDSKLFLYNWDTGKSTILPGATGRKLGDGAGPEYVPSIYDIKYHKQSVLPLQKGFRGTIDWLTPGQTFLAKNGFDDVIGLKVVDFERITEKQLLNTDNVSFTNYAYNTVNTYYAFKPPAKSTSLCCRIWSEAG